MKKAAVLTGIFLVSIFGFTACGGSGGSNEEPQIPTSKIAKRVFLLNQFSGKIQIVDAATDTMSSFSVPGDLLTFFARGEALIPAGNSILVPDSSSNLLHIIDKVTETRIAAVGLAGTPEGVALIGDNTRAYVAIPGQGRIDVVDVTAGKTLDPITGLAAPRRLAVTRNGSRLLAFSNDINSVAVINTSDRSVTTVGGFDRPFAAVISADDTRAFILSCGVECGGTQARVTVLNLADNSIGASVNVGGATVGLLEGNNLYVAGSPAVSTSSANGGTLNVVNVSNLAALTVSATFPISDGLHHTIVPVGNNKFYIGALRCTLINTGGVNKGCLSFFNGSSSSVGTARGDVTSIAPIKNRSVVYVTQGGELDIYDLASDTLQARQVDVIGRAVDAKEVD